MFPVPNNAAIDGRKINNSFDILSSGTAFSGRPTAASLIRESMPLTLELAGPYGRMQFSAYVYLGPTLLPSRPITRERYKQLLRLSRAWLCAEHRIVDLLPETEGTSALWKTIERLRGSLPSGYEMILNNGGSSYHLKVSRIIRTACFPLCKSSFDMNLIHDIIRAIDEKPLSSSPLGPADKNSSVRRTGENYSH
jgi:hypothetical protein